MKKIVIGALGIGVIVACSTSKNASGGKTGKGKQMMFEKSYMDMSVKPGEDFFRFANGTWVKNNPVPASESRWGSFNELDQANQEKLTAILDGLTKGDYAKGSYEQLLGAYYSSFMDMKKRDQLGLSVLKEDFARIKSVTNFEDLAKASAAMHREGNRVLFRFGVGQDLKNVEGHISYISQGGIGLPNKDYYTQENKKEILKSYEKHLEKLAVMSGENTTDAKKMAAASVKIETRLAESMMSRAELRIPEKSYNKFSRKDFEKMIPNFDFELYLSQLGSQSFDTVIVGQPDFFKELNRMVKEVNIDDWKSYMKLRTLDHYAGQLGSDFVKADFAFHEGVMSGKSEMKPANERAINELTRNPIGEALGKLFVEKHFSEEAMKRINELVDNLLVTFDERIKALDWMSDSTKQQALTKLNAIGRKLGYPSKWEDFSKLNLQKDMYLQNVKNIRIWSTQKSLGELYKPVDKEEWGMPAHMVNAYYHPLLNEIAFPAGIMQPPFFDEKAEDALNYGRIGMVIGHEFTHGFDDMGSKFAADGSFNNWWTETDRKAFEQRTTLLGNTFAGFCPIDGHCVNPDLTMGENIADLGGITLAYHAYMRTEEFKSGKKKGGYTPAQRFFLSFAQLWKINYTNEELKSRIANDPHSPGMYRVNGPLMNCPEFFEAFQIQEGEAMRNSSSKLSKIW
ncbi:MAG: M13 family peptidase [Bacteroidetes bacterium]|nr:MAG: M13 family peptidase [Bacteroidota bacterium]